MAAMEPLAVVQVLVGGLLLGGLYALAAAGLNLIFGVMRVINIAHGEFLMLGAYVAFFLWSAGRVNPLLSAPVAMLATGALGLAVMWLVVRRAMRGAELTPLLATYGLSVLLTNLALQAFQGVFRSVPAWSGAFQLSGVTVSQARAIAFGAALVISLAVWLYLHHTMQGKAIRATAQHPEVAMACGIDVEQVRRLTFAIGSALAGAAGALLVSFLSVSPSVGGTFILRAFAICVVGGLGSFPGALAGGLILGVAESLAALWTTTQIAEAVAYFLLILVLLARPQGLLGLRERA
jgi:branched-chain amino acid transport system permease protein